jgi:transglycosylase-like protein with SLT domain
VKSPVNVVNVATIAALAIGAALLGLLTEPARLAHVARGQEDAEMVDIVDVVDVMPISIPALIEDAAARWGLPAGRMRCIAWRESTYRPWVTSPGGHRGLWQFADRTWAWASWSAGVGGASPYDPVASTEAAAWLMSQPGGWWHWSTARWC